MFNKKIIVPIVLLLAALLMLSSCGDTLNDTPTQEYSAGETTDAEPASSAPEIAYIAELNSIAVIDAFKYSGTFVESGTNSETQNVAAITVVNTSDKTLQYMKIVEKFPDGTEYSYVLTTLPPNTVCTVQENSGAEFISPDSAQWSGSEFVFFESEPSLYRDEIKITGSVSILNIENISSNNIEDNVVVYYKNCKDGALLGGITYRVTFEGGISPDEIKQSMANHYSPDDSLIMFVDLTPAEGQ